MFTGGMTRVPNRSDWLWDGLISSQMRLWVVYAYLEFMQLPEATRYTRLYLPRRYEDLNRTYDL